MVTSPTSGITVRGRQRGVRDHRKGIQCSLKLQCLGYIGGMEKLVKQKPPHMLEKPML